MNVAAISGTIVEEPELRHTQDGLARLTTRLSFPTNQATEVDYEVKVIAFGDLASEIHKRYHRGDSVIVEGRLVSETRKKSSATSREELDVKEKVTELVARRFYPASTTSVLVQAQKSAETGRADKDDAHSGKVTSSVEVPGEEYKRVPVEPNKNPARLPAKTRVTAAPETETADEQIPF